MKRVREADHLSFPLQNTEDRGGVKSQGALLASFQPSNAHESAVDALLRSANLTEETVTKQEDELMGEDLTIEEIKEKRAELARQRDLMFRAEARSKRVAKIKSKTFRKLARRRAEKLGLSVDELERVDPEAADAEREKMERQRAKERATLRHGAKSRWAKDVGGDGTEMFDRRMAKQGMLDIKEKLRTKISGRQQDSDDDDDSDGSEDDEAAVKARAFDQLARSDDPESISPETGLMGMAFMKKARKRDMRKVADAEADARREIALFGEDQEGGDPGENEVAVQQDAAPVTRIGEGRLLFGSRIPSAPEENTLTEPVRTPFEAASKDSTRKVVSANESISATPATNPWLVPAASASAGPSRKRNSGITVNSTAEVKVVKALKKASRNKQAALEDEKVEISVDVAGPKQRGSGNVEDQEHEDNELLPIHGIKAFAQRQLVAEAFAGDNVVEVSEWRSRSDAQADSQEFAAEKARQVEADAPQVEDTSLPGWVSVTWIIAITLTRRAHGAAKASVNANPTPAS